MKGENIILDKSFAFALRILKLYLFLRKKNRYRFMFTNFG
jgi:hypothetical protein